MRNSTLEEKQLFELFHDGGLYHIETMDWFLYDNGLRHERVKATNRIK